MASVKIHGLKWMLQRADKHNKFKAFIIFVLQWGIKTNVFFVLFELKAFICGEESDINH